MILTIFIAFISLLGLVILHEFGHFILAKKFGVKVEEFGIGYPPRLFGKKIGETIYSLNLLPFGAFVRIYGETERIKDPRSFFSKPFWQKALIVLGGVVSFWLISAILLTIVMSLGAPTIIGDNEDFIDAKVQIVAISPDSPAEQAGLQIGDAVKEFRVLGSSFQIKKVNEIQELTEKYKGKMVFLTIQRGKEVFESSLSPRAAPPSGQGPMGVVLARTALKSYPWYLAPIKGIEATLNLTGQVAKGWAQALIKLFKREPTGVQLMGPVGIFGLFTQVWQMGIVYFLQFIAIISIYVAFFNILPIPVVDGGRLLFLVIEKIKGGAINQKLEQNINAFCFIFLILLMIWVTIKDISRLF